MKTTPLKFILPVVGISVLSGCYTQLSEPLSREEYYTEPDTVYQYEETDLSEYNLGYREGYRDFLNDHLWYGYNPDSYFYHSHRPYWDSPWSYHHSFYLGVYDPYFYDPFWDWGYSGYYSPYSYYGYNYGYYHPYSRHYYSHGYYYHGGYAGTKKVSEGREQLTANRQPASGSASASQASRVPVSNNSDFQNTLNLPMASGSGNSSTTSGSSQPGTQSLPDGIVKPDKSARNIQTLDVRPTKSPDEDVPGFQTTLIPPARPETKLIKNRSTSSSSGKRTITLPVKKSSSVRKSQPPSKSSSSETKSVSKPKSSSSSSSGKSSRSSYKTPSKSSSSSSSSSRSSSVRSSPKSKSSSSRSSNSSSSKSSSSKSSSSKSSSSKSSSKKSR